MATNFKDVDVVCPFYRNISTHLSVTCEGESDKDCIMIRFENKKSYLEHLQSKCCNIDGYKDCIICTALIQKYGEW